MIHENIALHNVAEVRPAPGDYGGSPGDYRQALQQAVAACPHLNIHLIHGPKPRRKAQAAFAIIKPGGANTVAHAPRSPIVPLRFLRGNCSHEQLT